MENENDNVPLTDEAVYYPTVPESSPAGTKVLQLEAFDSDIDPLQKLTYRITSGNPEGFFAINGTSGKCVKKDRLFYLLYFLFIYYLIENVWVGKCKTNKKFLLKYEYFCIFCVCWLE